MHLPCQVVNFNANQIKICCILSNLSNFINIASINSYLESFTVFSRKILRWCLTFDAVYI